MDNDKSLNVRPNLPHHHNNHDDDDVFVNPDVTPDNSYCASSDEIMESDDETLSSDDDNSEQSYFDEDTLQSDDEEILSVPQDIILQYGHERDETTQCRYSKRLRSASYRPKKLDPDMIDVTQLDMKMLEDEQDDDLSVDDKDIADRASDDDYVDEDVLSSYDTEDEMELQDFIVDDNTSVQNTFMSTLQSRRYKKDDVKPCILCKKKIHVRQMVFIMPCGHDAFHANCLRQYLAEEKTCVCPLCTSSSSSH